MLFADDSSSDGHGENAAEMEASDESGNEENGDAAQSDAWKKMKAIKTSNPHAAPSIVLFPECLLSFRAYTP
jgi:hypothetical protein